MFWMLFTFVSFVYVRNFRWTRRTAVTALLQLQRIASKIYILQNHIQGTMPANNVFKTSWLIFLLKYGFRSIQADKLIKMVIIEFTAEWSKSYILLTNTKKPLCNNVLHGFLLCLESDTANQSVKVRHHRHRVTSDQSYWRGFTVECFHSNWPCEHS